MLTWSLNVLLALAAPADLILTGGHVVALEDPAAAPAGPRPTALAIRDGRVLALGRDAAIEALAGPRTGRVALRGATVLPGLTDAHLHVESLERAVLVRRRRRLEDVDLAARRGAHDRGKRLVN